MGGINVPVPGLFVVVAMSTPELSQAIERSCNQHRH
jgi:hypothetical protein